MKIFRPIISQAQALLWSMVLLFAGCFFVACSDDGDDVGDAYLYLEGDTYTFEFGTDGNVGHPRDTNGNEQKNEWNDLRTAYCVQGCSMRMQLFSNMGDWTIEPLYAEDSEWIDIWPNYGSNDGRFWLTVDRNLTGYSRTTDVNIIAGGKIVRTISISQKANTPTIEVDMGGLSLFTIPTPGASRTVKIKANAGWKAVAEDEAAEWITFENQTETTVDVVVKENPQEDSRSGKVLFMIAGTGNESTNASIEIMQKGQAANIARAEKRTIAELIAQKDGSGKIQGNVYVEGVVINDPTTKNVDPAFITWNAVGNAVTSTIDNRQMWVQDESGKGLLIEFLDASYNTYNFNDHVKLHLVGQQFSTDKTTGATKISGMTSDEIPECTPGAPIEPTTLADFSQIADYENSLVRIDPVEFIIPMGTYVNIDERQYNNTTTDGRIDGTAQYAHLLRDSKGAILPLYTAASFTERFASAIPQGSGPITAIVTKNIVAGETQTILRLRHDSDNEISNDAATRMTKEVVAFRWFSRPVLDEVVAATGTGKIKTSIFSNVVAPGLTTAIYWAWTYARREAATVNEDGTVTPPQPDDLDAVPDWQYPCINVNTWWDGNGSSIRNRGTDVGEAWIVTVSTAGATGDLSLVFTTSSSASGPGNYILEWAPTEDAAMSEFKKIGEYKVGNWSANYQCKEMYFALPDEIKNCESVVIRHRVSANQRAAKASSTIGTTGTNRLGYWGIIEKK